MKEFSTSFGSGLHDLLFKPATETFEEDLENTINDAVSSMVTLCYCRRYQY